METYITRGTCSRKINFEIEDGKIKSCEFVGGCTGNTQGISKLVVGMKVEDVIARTKGIICRGGTSCPDQLSKALEEYLNK
ncbi:MAG: TIGR03905 family TSCPD domain-containing protein [Clostridia bacterium]|nr:TIGR03905 family TSCPD domain-containing protein [Clostridia bacterium]